jgi:hypothetical protein
MSSGDKQAGKAPGKAKAATPITVVAKGCPNGPSCREPCCIKPARTPSDEDSPSWQRMKRIYDAMEDAKELPFTSPARHPWKVGTNSGATPSSYASSSFSPSDDPDLTSMVGRRQSRAGYGQDPDAFTPAGVKSRRHR